MDTEVTQQTESTQVESQVQQDVSTQAQAEPQTEAYQPNYKFTIGKEEKEFDDFVRGAISSKEHEEKLRDLYTKAYGIEEIKKSREALQAEYQKYRSEYEPVMNTFQTGYKTYEKAMQALQAKDNYSFVNYMDKTMEALGLPKKTLQSYLYYDLKNQDMPDDQKQIYARNHQVLSEKEQLESKLKEYEQLNTQTQSKLLEYDYKMAVSSTPEVSSVVSQFDAIKGAGSFEQLCAQTYYATKSMYGYEPSMQEIVQHVKMVAAAQVPQQQMTQPQAEMPNSTEKPKVLPVVKGGSNVVKKKITSVEDLEKLYQSMA